MLQYSGASVSNQSTFQENPSLILLIQVTVHWHLDDYLRCFITAHPESLWTLTSECPMPAFDNCLHWQFGAPGFPFQWGTPGNMMKARPWIDINNPAGPFFLLLCLMSHTRNFSSGRHYASEGEMLKARCEPMNPVWALAGLSAKMQPSIW